MLHIASSIVTAIAVIPLIGPALAVSPWFIYMALR